MTFDTPIPIDETFAAAPASGEERDRYSAAAAWSEARDGRALLVLSGTEIRFERYANGGGAEVPQHLFSGTKSFSCPLALGLEADGLLSLDEPVARTIPELAAGDAVQVRHLLDFTSGVAQSWGALTLDGLRARQRVADKYAFAVDLPAEDPPGTRFRYGSSHQMILGELVERKTGASPLAWLQARVFDPIGMRTAGWNHDPSGNPMLPYGAWTTAREWAKFGVLMRDDGVWQGARVLPEGIRDRCATGSEANPAYGLNFWLNAPVSETADLGGIRALVADGQPALLPGGPADLFAAAGGQDQRLYIIPSQNLVIVRLGGGDRDFDDREFLALLLGP